MTEIITIPSRDANCYLLRNDAGDFLIDAGYHTARTELLTALADAGCTPDRLKLIILTHGDIDHAGNAAAIRRVYRTSIAMHAGDLALVEQGAAPHKTCRSLLIKIVLGISQLFHRDLDMADFERFTPDILLDEDTDLSEYGLDARVLHLPGHTAGSVGILTSEGDLFSGDTLMNTRLSFIVAGWAENHDDVQRSIERLLSLPIETVYPGHLKPFKMAAFVEKNRQEIHPR